MSTSKPQVVARLEASGRHKACLDTTSRQERLKEVFQPSDSSSIKLHLGLQAVLHLPSTRRGQATRRPSHEGCAKKSLGPHHSHDGNYTGGGHARPSICGGHTYCHVRSSGCLASRASADPM